MDGQILKARAPCLLPQLSDVKVVRTVDANYHPIAVRRRKLMRTDVNDEYSPSSGLNPSDLTVLLKKKIVHNVCDSNTSAVSMRKKIVVDACTKSIAAVNEIENLVDRLVYASLFNA